VDREEKRRNKRGRETEEKRKGTLDQSYRNGTLGQLIELRGRERRMGDRGQIT
jgi:hypothetical protein